MSDHIGDVKWGENNNLRVLASPRYVCLYSIGRFGKLEAETSDSDIPRMDAGIQFEREHLDALIALLEEARRRFPIDASGSVKPAKNEWCKTCNDRVDAPHDCPVKP